MGKKLTTHLKEFLFGRHQRIQQPIFVVGCGRSGTTLLFDTLSTHPGVAKTTGYPDGEDHEGWIEHGRCIMAGIGNAHHSKYGNGINGHQQCLHMTQDDVTDEIISDMHDHYFKNVLKENFRLRVVNKQPHLSNKLGYVLGIFPDAKIVHIVRDCEPMVASWLAVMDSHPSLVIYWPREEDYPCLWLMPKSEDSVSQARFDRHRSFFPGGGAEIFIDYWNKVNTGISRQMVGHESQLITIRYEDLVSSPEKTLSQIIEFCELPFFDFSINHLEVDTAQRHAGRLTSELRVAIAEKSRYVRRSFGYEPGHLEALAPSLYLP